MRQSLNVSTTPITAIGCRQCISTKGKHCHKPNCCNGAVDIFGQIVPISCQTLHLSDFIFISYIVQTALLSFLPHYCHAFHIIVIPSIFLSFLSYQCHSLRISVIPSELLPFQIIVILNSSCTLRSYTWRVRKLAGRIGHICKYVRKIDEMTSNKLKYQFFKQ